MDLFNDIFCYNIQALKLKKDEKLTFKLEILKAVELKN